MHKFFVDEDNIFDNKAIIEGEDVKHIYKVLRLKEGEEVNINNCRGEEYLGQIEEINKSQVKVNLIEKLKINNESPIDIYLFQGLPKGSKMDLIVQKCTELGVVQINPVITKRVLSSYSIIKKDEKKVDRWNRIAFEACKQSKRTLIPSVGSIIEFKDMIDKLKNMDLIVVPYENQENFGVKSLIKNLKKEVKSVGVVIGPEGGFEDSEIDILKNIGAYIVTLGPRILRTETAGVICTSLLMYELGDLGGII